MPEFLTPVDIGNRALQHVGSKMIASFTEGSAAARQVSFAYGKLRRAELRRSTWTFATRKAALRPIDTNTMLLQPALWVQTTSYYRGQVVIDSSNTAWRSRVQNNLGYQPQSSPQQWEPYFGPLSVSLYDSTQSYNSGELVYTAAGDGTSRTYLSLLDGNADNPATATAWDATVTYQTGSVVTYSSVAYKSLIDLNLNQTPTSSPANWAVGTTYALNALVNGSDNVTYKSLGNGNVGNNPTTDGGVHWQNTGILTPWTSVFVGGTGSVKWLEIGGAEFPNGAGITTFDIIYPLGAGPATDTSSRNVYRLPAGFLRRAPQDPKAGSNSNLGGPSGEVYDDWLIEGDYLITAEVGPILLRFVADFQDVTRMDDMFCEALGYRVALEVCEALTQSTAKLAAIADEYRKFRSEALTVDSIESGAVEPPMDDFVACRA